jgi:formate C-acetyltransferase
MLYSLTGEKRARVQRIRARLVESRPGICPERAQIYTRAYQQFENQPPILKRARALRMYLENLSIYLGEDDLIPGWQSSHPRWAPIFPEYAWKWVYDELDRFNHRQYEHFHISDEAREELRRILPWWQGRSLFERIEARQPDFVKEASRMGVTSWTWQATSGEGHIVGRSSAWRWSAVFEALRARAASLKEGLVLYEPQALDQRDFMKRWKLCAMAC